MTELSQQILVLIAFASVLYLLNLKAGARWFKFVTYWLMLATVTVAGFLIVDWLVP